jgi:hypothetical protein
MKKEFWIIEENNFGDFDDKEEKCLNFVGPFSSIKEIEKRLREDCVDAFKKAEHENLEEEEVIEDFCSRFKIVETVKTVQPVPVVSINSRIEEL